MSALELIVLGTASAVPTRKRNHNGYFVRWGAQGYLFDPGEGTQQQMSRAGLSAHNLTQVCITHFHGDHCLGLPGVIQRIARDGVPHPVDVAYPAAGEEYFQRLRWASDFQPTDSITARPLEGPSPAPFGDPPITALPLRHSIPVYGYRIEEPVKTHMRADALAAKGVAGPSVGELKAKGTLVTSTGEVLALADYSYRERGRSFAIVMDTGVCAGAAALAKGVDMLLIEATYLSSESALAAKYLHLTARQAARIAAEAGVRKLVLTHFSERYTAQGFERFAAEAAEEFSGDIVIANDLDRIGFPAR
ncbi:ribonuclease Z [Hoyosella altamirensis]|uniref:Ribonuclease Z n=1 Tax=Hoyosella altamirensis TaxID=616997 RepID=A0A839RN26_9ACTN|nr:ribonuclease Z [Hoyosella altamirensis]MBB3037598.1 ribonuclease Z [Hoyosella altamirensis]